MKKNLLSIDWDYFIPIKERWYGSYIENRRNNVIIWYRRYFEDKKKGINIEKSVKTGRELIGFWNVIKEHFIIKKKAKVYVSDSHKFSYYIGENSNCGEVINFDAHSDLGYGGIKSLDFELNCANWLGKLLKNEVVNKVRIVYSPYTYESKDEFQEINQVFNVKYPQIEDIKDKTAIDYIHICRSGSWTPPWLDCKFYEFIKDLNMPYKVVKCPKRHWNPEGLTLSDKIYITL
ncbi:arginase [Clostridium sp. Mt-5]|uniref:Arginase n=1 Tax=Clostridium moutaii TaxID=3240932 RepID=A0ABV4BPI8_9CLOT